MTARRRTKPDCKIAQAKVYNSDSLGACGSLVLAASSARVVLPALFMVLAPCASAGADVIHVPKDFPTIQEAIDSAADGDEIIVAPGTYNETIDFLGKAVALRSADGQNVTTIDDDGVVDAGDLAELLVSWGSCE